MQDDNERQRELDKLVARVNADELSPLEISHLSEILVAEPTAIDRYLDQIEMEAMLSETYGLLQTATSPKPLVAPGIRSNRNPTKIRLMVVLAVAAGLLVIGSLAGLHKESDAPSAESERRSLVEKVNDGLDESGPAVCLVSHRTATELHRSIDAKTSRTLTEQRELAAGLYELDAGLLELTFASGATVIVQAPAEFRLISKKHVSVLQGRVHVHCPTEESHGFLVETPSTVATDLGTEFAVEVNSDRRREDEFHVFEGEVALRSKHAPYRLNLVGGQATRLDHVTATPAGIDLDQQRFIRSLKSTADEYHDAILSLRPDLYYTMQDTGSGELLVNAVEDRYHAEIVCPKSMTPRASGFCGGTSFAMDGMRHQVYALAPDFPKANGDHLSVVAWIYAESRPCWASIAKNWRHASSPESRGQFHFGLFRFSGRLEASINDKDNREVFVLDETPLPLHQWHHVAFVVEPKSLRLYRNGQLVGTSPCNGLAGNRAIKPLGIGTKLGNDDQTPAVTNNGFWDGRIDHLSLFNHSLSGQEVKHLYELGVNAARRYAGDY